MRDNLNFVKLPRLRKVIEQRFRIFVNEIVLFSLANFELNAILI